MRLPPDLRYNTRRDDFLGTPFLDSSNRLSDVSQDGCRSDHKNLHLEEDERMNSTDVGVDCEANVGTIL